MISMVQKTWTESQNPVTKMELTVNYELGQQLFFKLCHYNADWTGKNTDED